MFVIYSIVFVLGLFVSSIVTPLCIRAALKFGYVDRPSERKIHTEIVPYGGGVALFLSLSLIVLILYLVANNNLFLPEDLPEFIDLNVLLKDTRALSFLFGALGIFILGLLDDIYDIPAKGKLLLQMIIVSLVIKYSSMTMSFFIHTPWVGFIGTLLWIILITNAFNLLDNMDGVCAGVSIITLLIYFVLLITFQQYLVSLLTLVVSAPLVVFMFYNKPPAKVYLGDAGSLMLGFLIAILSVMSTYYRDGQHLSTYFTPLLILAIPIFDVITVMAIRYRLGTPFFKADKNHFSHRLLNLGLSPVKVLLIILSITFVMGLGAIFLIHSNQFQSLIILAEALILFIMIVIFEKVGVKRKQSLSIDD
jgi:UDP-GlcNAc:undecaprenyl-phosphate/decaprenyl-phosphate GlcNAc-1-phosphate transferase